MNLFLKKLRSFPSLIESFGVAKELKVDRKNKMYVPRKSWKIKYKLQILEREKRKFYKTIYQ